MKSWQTTLAGIFTILGAISDAGLKLLDGDPTTNPEYAIVAAAVAAGWGLIRARDNDKSSEAVNAK